MYQVVNDIWNTVTVPLHPTQDITLSTIQGEGMIPLGMPYTQRLFSFLDPSQKGDARAQHSDRLLPWSGYCRCHHEQLPIESVLWHGAVAYQGSFG